jgi:hypothetical protein
VPDNRGTFIEEAVSAGRGLVALIVGDRKAPNYFDLSQRGMVGSFVGLLGISLVSAILPLLLPGVSESYSIARSTAMAAILFAFQIGFAVIVLRQIKRMDGLVPYLVADNWASVYISAGQLVLSIFGFDGQITFFALSILVIVVEINIGRLIVTLTPLQIAMFMIAQLVGISIALLLIGFMFPIPEAAAAAAGAS